MRIEYYWGIKAKLEKKIKKIDELINANPVGEIIEIRRKLLDIINSDIDIKAKAEKVIELQKEERKQRRIYKYQKTHLLKLIDKKVDLMSDLNDCANEISRIKMQKGG